MTFASWFSSQHSHRRPSRTGVRRKRSCAFHRRASFDALEHRSLLSTATVNFLSGGESVDESAGTFSIPVTVSGTPDGTPTVSNFASGFIGPYGVAFDSAGNLYVANGAKGTVSKVAEAGGTPSTFASGFKFPVGLAFDSNFNLYVADDGADTVNKVPAGGGTPTTFATGFNDPTDLAFDATGNLYVANVGDGTVSMVPPGGGTPTTFATGFDEPDGLAFDAVGNLYVANLGNNTVSEVPRAGGASKTFATGFDGPVGLAFDAHNNLYVVDQTNATVDEVPATGGAATAFATGFDFPAGLALHAGSLYVANHGNGTVSQVTETLAVPFGLGGTAASGVAFSSVTANPLTFGIGQFTADITGTLLSDPGSAQTLTVTLDAPRGAPTWAARLSTR